MGAEKLRILDYLALALIFQLLITPGSAEVSELSAIENALEDNEFVLILFYTTWCQHSNKLLPIFDEAADVLKAEHSRPGHILLAKVDCDTQSMICENFGIRKYPTLKIVHFGHIAKREYRGERKVESIVEFVRNESKTHMTEYSSFNDLEQIGIKRRMVAGYFVDKNESDYQIFRAVAASLKEDCDFFVGFGYMPEMKDFKRNGVVYNSELAISHKFYELYEGNLSSFQELRDWTRAKCLPLVRELTFDNAEDITEEGLPLLILFHTSDDLYAVKKYMTAVTSELMDERQNFNFVMANGLEFLHPLYHLGKTENDLPLVVIDSYEHMYEFPKFADIEKPGKLKQFILDLRSGKLHREYHFGPDEPIVEPESNSTVTDVARSELPESKFKDLKPSEDRYTFLNRDEL